jgi:hypothetical protein
MATELPERQRGGRRGRGVAVTRSRRLGLVGRELCGEWRLERLLGSGGVSSVYAAVDRGGKRVAIKVLCRDLAGNQQVRSRFTREVSIANRIAHPGVVAVFDDGEDGDLVFLVMELLDGETLAARARRLGGVLTGQEVGFVADGLLEVLAAAHARGIVHRDVKPDNVFLTRAGQVKLLDFGIARLRELSLGVQQTRVGRALGTPGFMAPEQAAGCWAEVDARTDLWAVGAMMFRLLSGRPVHARAPIAGALDVAATQPAPSLGVRRGDLPRPLVALVDRALAFAPADRWQDAREMQAALRRVRAELPAHVWEPPPPERSAAYRATAGERHRMGVRRVRAQPARPRPTAVALAVAGVVAVGALSFWGFAPPLPAAAPEVPAARGDMAEEAARAYLDAAERLAQANAFAPALEMLSRTRALAIGNPAIQVRLARLTEEIAVARTIGRSRNALALGDAKHAGELAEQALALDPGNAEALRLIAGARKRLGHE